MKTRLPGLALAGLLLAMQGAASAAVVVNYIQDEKFTDLPRVPWQRQQALEDIAEHFQALGKTLGPGQDLSIAVLDVDLAGREQPNRYTTDSVRIIRGGGDWPRMRLRYTLSENGKPVRSGEAQLSDKSYSSRIKTYASDERLPYEKQMIDAWWRTTLQPDRSARR
jgi:hypothetical protein